MWGTVKIVAMVLLLVLAAAVVLMFWVLCKAAKEEFEDAPPPPKGKAEDPCESCVRWSECEGVDKDCPLRR